MKKAFISILFILIYSSLSFGQDTTFFNTNWEICNKVESHYYRVDIKKGGLIQRTDHFSEDNQVQMQGQYKSLNPEIKTGGFKWYHANGNLKHEGQYENDKEIGKHNWYFTNGNIEAVENYVNGKLDGKFLEYHDNGKISIETAFQVGVHSGLTKYYRPDGTLHSEGDFKDGDRNGVWKYYDENGEFIDEVEYKTDYIIEEAKMQLILPNSEWLLGSYQKGELTEYVFKRAPIKDSNGIDIIPAIMVYVEDASSYDDLILYSAYKQKPIVSNGIEIDEILAQADENYPISYNNSLLYKCHYTQQGIDHILYMVHIMDKNKNGIEILMDMTKDIADEYESEFLQTLKSLKKL